MRYVVVYWNLLTNYIWAYIFTTSRVNQLKFFAEEFILDFDSG